MNSAGAREVATRPVRRRRPPRPRRRPPATVNAGRRRQRARRIAQLVDQRAALVAVRAVRRGDREGGQVAVRGGGQGRGHEPVAAVRRAAVEQLVLREREPRVHVHHALDAADPRVRGQAPGVLVQLRDVLRARWRPRSCGRRGRCGANSPSPNSRASMSYASRDGTDGGRIVASGALNRTWRNGRPRTSRSARVGTSTATGWRITRRARRAHGPSAPGSTVTFRTARASMRVPEDREDRRQQRQRGRDREAHDDRAGDAHRAQDHELEQHQAQEAQQDRQAGEEHGAAGRGDGDPDGLRRRGPGPRGGRSSSRKRLVISSE